MNKTFNKQQIAQIALKVRQYKKLYVTTEGQMFLSSADADEAVRVKNMIIDEPDDYVGVTEITEEMVTNDKLHAFAKDLDAFGKLFENAKIPRIRDTKKDKFERKRETPTVEDTKESENVAKALGIADAPASNDVEPETKPADTKKIIPASSTSTSK